MNSVAGCHKIVSHTVYETMSQVKWFNLQGQNQEFKKGGGGGGVRQNFLQKGGGGGPTTYSEAICITNKQNLLKKGGQTPLDPPPPPPPPLDLPLILTHIFVVYAISSLVRGGITERQSLGGGPGGGGGGVGVTARKVRVQYMCTNSGRESCTLTEIGNLNCIHHLHLFCGMHPQLISNNCLQPPQKVD